MSPQPTPVYLFIGDSVTDCGRREDADRNLGDGYVRRVDEALPAGSSVTVINRGISGNRVRDLRARWSADCITLEPDLVSVLVGVNDMWRRYDSDDPTSPEHYEEDYRAILDELRATQGSRDVRLVLVEPFLIPISDEQRSWRSDLDTKIEVVHGLASAFNATLVPADTAFTAHAGRLGAEALAADGVHPTPLGHKILADLWLDTVRP